MGSSTDVNRKARYWSLGAVGLGVAVVLIATFSSRRFILEEWHLSSLESGDKEKRERAAKALGDIGSVRAIPLLTQASCESSGDDFEATVSVMAQVFADVSVLSLTSPFKISVASLGGLSIRRLRAFRVNQSVSLDRQFEDLAKQVADRLTDNPHFEALTKIVEREKRAAVPHLAERLKGDKWLVRWHAARLLGVLGPDAEDSVQMLKTKLEDSNSFVRYAAAEALKSIGHDDEQ